MSNSIQGNILESIRDENLIEIYKGSGEIAIDSILNDGLLKDVPVIGAFISTVKGVASIRDKIFLQKLLHFLTCQSDITEDEKNEFIGKLDGKKKEKIGESLIHAIEKIESVEKATMLGNLFKAFVYDEIDFKTFQRFSWIVQSMFLEDLNVLVENEAPFDEVNHGVTQQLYINKLIDISAYTLDEMASMSINSYKYEITDAGEIFVKYALNKDENYYNSEYSFGI